MDENLKSLAAVLDGFPGLRATDGQEAEGQWYIAFDAQHTEEGWRSLEFIAWAVSDLKRGGHRVILEATALPPYLNTPGECLLFVLRGQSNAADSGGVSPEGVSVFLTDIKDDYVPAGEE